MSKKTILLVEDNPDDVALTLRVFEKCRISNEIVVARDGSEALDYLFGRGTYADRQAFPVPNLILLDLRLPKIDGLEVLKEVKADAKVRTIPVVVLTTSEAERDMAMAYEYHANSYVTKPVDFSTFNKLLHDLGFYWLAWNKRPW